MNYKFIITEGKKSQKLSQIIKKKIKYCTKIRIISGFLSEAGFRSIFGQNDKENRIFLSKLDYILVGRLNTSTYNTFSWIYTRFPESRNKLYVNYGLGRLEFGRITKFIPMIHSKIIALDFNESSSLIYIGSANITDYALNDLNAEAGLLIYELDKTERSCISNYMEALRKKKSTKLYDPENAYNLISLNRLSIRDEERYLEEFIRIDKISIVFCYNPSSIGFSKGDIFYTELTPNSNKIVKDIHGIIHHKINKFVIFYFFDKMNDLINFRLENATVQPTINTGLIKEPIQLRIKGILAYLEYIPPFIIKKQTELKIKPSSGKSFQAFCEIIDKEDLPKEYRIYCELKNDEEITKKLIASERIKSKQLYTSVDSNNQKVIDSEKYIELEDFNIEKNYKTLKDVLSKRAFLNMKIEFLEDFCRREKIFLSELSEIEKQGEIKKYLADFEKQMALFENNRYQETLMPFVKKTGIKDKFIEFLASLKQYDKELLKLESYLFNINKKLKNF